MNLFKKFQRNNELKLKKEIAALKKSNKEKTEIIKNLEKFINMYERVIELGRQELIQANATLNAQNSVSEMTRQELITKDQIIDAQQHTLDLSTDERKEEEGIIEAWKSVIDLARKERMQSEEIIRALEQVGELSKLEKKQRDIEIEAMENTINYSAEQKFTYESTANAYEKIQALSDAEKLYILKLLNKKIRFDFKKLKKIFEANREE